MYHVTHESASGDEGAGRLAGRASTSFPAAPLQPHSGSEPGATADSRGASRDGIASFLRRRRSFCATRRAAALPPSAAKLARRRAERWSAARARIPSPLRVRRAAGAGADGRDPRGCGQKSVYQGTLASIRSSYKLSPSAAARRCARRRASSRRARGTSSSTSATCAACSSTTAHPRGADAAAHPGARRGDPAAARALRRADRGGGAVRGARARGDARAELLAPRGVARGGCSGLVTETLSALTDGSGDESSARRARNSGAQFPWRRNPLTRARPAPASRTRSASCCRCALAQRAAGAHAARVHRARGGARERGRPPRHVYADAAPQQRVGVRGRGGYDGGGGGRRRARRDADRRVRRAPRRPPRPHRAAHFEHRDHPGRARAHPRQRAQPHRPPRAAARWRVPHTPPSPATHLPTHTLAPHSSHPATPTATRAAGGPLDRDVRRRLRLLRDEPAHGDRARAGVLRLRHRALDPLRRRPLRRLLPPRALDLVSQRRRLGTCRR